MNLLFALFFGAGFTAWCYSRIGRRIGYGNTQNIFVTLAVIFVISTVVFFTILVTLVPHK